MGIFFFPNEWHFNIVKADSNEKTPSVIVINGYDYRESDALSKAKEVFEQWQESPGFKRKQYKLVE